MKIFRDCLREQLVMHPAMEPRDVVKLCYQAACGAEHLLGYLVDARYYFEEEYQTVIPKDEPLYERISESVCRVNLLAWKQKGLPKEWLFRMFTGTVFSSDGKQRLNEYLAAAEAVLLEQEFHMDNWKLFLEQYRADGMPAVRHSESYRAAEQPSYRIVDTAYLPLLPILERVVEAKEIPKVIDEKMWAGESNLTNRLKRVLGADIIIK